MFRRMSVRHCAWVAAAVFVTIGGRCLAISGMVTTQVAISVKVLDQENIRQLPLDNTAFEKLAHVPLAAGVDAQFSGRNMNWVHASVNNTNDAPATVAFYPGIHFVSSIEDDQDMLGVRYVVMTVMPKSTGECDIRSVCANRVKHEPSKNTFFTPTWPADPHLPLLCADIGAGHYWPWKQCEAWLYTNHSTLEECNSTIVPACSPGNYLNAAYKYATICQIDPHDDKFASLLQPQMLLDADTTADTARWYVGWQCSRDATGTLRVMQGLWTATKDRLSNQPSPTDLDRCAGIGLGMCEFPNPDVQIGGLNFLTNAIPDTLYSDILKRGLQPSIIGCLRSDNPNVVLGGLDAAGHYKVPIGEGLWGALTTANAADGGAKVKEQAATLPTQPATTPQEPEITQPTLVIRPADPRIKDAVWGVSQRDFFNVELIVPRDQAAGMKDEVTVTFKAEKTGKSVIAVLNNRHSAAKGPVVYTLDHAQCLSGSFASIPGRNRITQIGPFDFTVDDFLSELHTENGDTVTATYGNASTSIRVFDTRSHLVLAQYAEAFDHLNKIYADALLRVPTKEGREAITRKMELIADARLHIDYKAANDDVYTDTTRIEMCRGVMTMLQSDPATWGRLKDPAQARPGIPIYSMVEWDNFTRALRMGREDWQTAWIRPMAELTIELYQVGVSLTGADQAVMVLWGLDTMGNRVDNTARFFAGVGLGSQLLLVGAGVAKGMQTMEAGVQFRTDKLAGITKGEQKAIIAAEQRAATVGEQRIAAAAGATTKLATATTAVARDPALVAAERWSASTAASPGLRGVEDTVATGHTLTPAQVMDLKADPAAMRSLKSAPATVRQAFNDAENAVYKVHDQAVVDHVKGMDTVGGKDAPWKGKEVKVQDFRTPGGDPNGINTDRDFRVVYKEVSDGGKENWIEVPRKYWKEVSTEEFAKASGYSEEKLRSIAAPVDIAKWDHWVDTPGGPTKEEAMKEKWAELHQQLATDKSHPEASPDFTDQFRDISNNQPIQGQANVLDVKKGTAVLEDAQRFGMMYNEKADAYLRLRSALHPDGDKLEAMAQMRKGIDMLDDVRSGYTKLYGQTGKVAPIGTLSDRFVQAEEAVKSLAPYDKTIGPERIVQVEARLGDLGFRGLDDFRQALDSQFHALGSVPAP